MEHKISAPTLARTIILLLAVANQMLNLSGHSIIPIDDEVINLVVGNLWMILAALRCWWKNNSFSKPALVGDAAMSAHKSDATVDSTSAQ